MSNLEEYFLPILFIIMGIVVRVFRDEKIHGSMIRYWYILVLVGVLQLFFKLIDI